MVTEFTDLINELFPELTDQIVASQNKLCSTGSQSVGSVSSARSSSSLWRGVGSMKFQLVFVVAQCLTAKPKLEERGFTKRRYAEVPNMCSSLLWMIGRQSFSYSVDVTDQLWWYLKAKLCWPDFLIYFLLYGLCSILKPLCRLFYISGLVCVAASMADLKYYLSNEYNASSSTQKIKT